MTAARVATRIRLQLWYVLLLPAAISIPFTLFGSAPCGNRGVTALSPNPLTPTGKIGAYYFETADESQVWINLEPGGLKLHANPVQLNVTVRFPGRNLAQAPVVVEIRAKAADSVFPMTIRKPILRFRPSGMSEIDLTAPGRSYRFVSGCQDCSADTVLASMTFSALRQIAESGAVDMDAVGFAVRLTSKQLESLREFVCVVSHGVQIR